MTLRDFPRPGGGGYRRAARRRGALCPRRARPRDSTDSALFATRARRSDARDMASGSSRHRPRTSPSRSATTQAYSRSESRDRLPKRRRAALAPARLPSMP